MPGLGAKFDEDTTFRSYAAKNLGDDPILIRLGIHLEAEILQSRWVVLCS